MDITCLLKQLKEGNSHESEGIANKKLRSYQSKKERRPFKKRSYQKRRKPPVYEIEIDGKIWHRKRPASLTNEQFIILWERVGPNGMHEITKISQQSILDRARWINDLLWANGLDIQLRDWSNPDYQRPEPDLSLLCSPLYLVNSPNQCFSTPSFHDAKTYAERNIGFVLHGGCIVADFRPKYQKHYVENLLERTRKMIEK